MNRKKPTMMTEDQLMVELLAAELATSAAVKKQKDEILKVYRGMPEYTWPEGQETLEEAVDDMALAAALAAANSDTARPKMIWTMTAALAWDGYRRADSQWAAYNPDNIYRFAPIDDASSYEITVHAKPPVPVQFCFLLWNSYLGENTIYEKAPGQHKSEKTKSFDMVVGGLLDSDMKPEADGSIKIAMDSSPANGRINHIQTNAEARVLFIRDTFNEWGTQNFLDIDIKRVGGPAAGALPDKAELARRAALILEGGANTTKWFVDDILKKQPNMLETPWLRGGGWGFGGSGHYKLAEDEALLVQLDPLGVEYLNIVVYDPWLVSRPHIHNSGSLNNRQAEQNPDGSYSYVVCAKDPGIRNWLDTSGHHQGFLFTRWQVLPKGFTSTEGSVRSAKVVKFDDLQKLLPGATKITPDARAALNAERAKTYAHHHGIPEQ